MRFFFTIGACLLLFGCTPGSGQRWGEERWDTTTNYRLTAEIMSWDRPIYGEGDFLFAGDLLIFEGATDDALFSVYRSKHDSLLFLGSFLRQGHGPWEATDAEAFYFPNSRTLVAVAYNPLGHSIRIPLDSSARLFDLSSWTEECYGETNPIPAYELVPIDDTLCIAQTFDGHNSLFSLYDTRREVWEPLDIPYPDDRGSMPYGQRAEAYMGSVAKHPTRNRFAYSNANSKLVLLFDVEERKAQRIEQPFCQIPEYEPQGRDRVRFTANHDNGYQLSVTGRRVYCADPRIDRLDREASIARNGYGAGYVREIFVMEWNGRPLATYSLDRPVCFPTVSPDDRYLYAFALDDKTLEGYFVRFRLPELPQ